MQFYNIVIVKEILMGVVKRREKYLDSSGLEYASQKKEGGLGVRDISFFNKALVGKWGWRLLEEDTSLWASVVTAKYGYFLEQNVVEGYS